MTYILIMYVPEKKKKKINNEKRLHIALELELVIATSDTKENELKLAPKIAKLANNPGITVGRFDSQLKYKTQYYKHPGDAVAAMKDMVAITDRYAQKCDAIIVAHPISRFPPRVENLGAEFIGMKLHMDAIPSMFTSSLTMCFICSSRVEQIKVGKTLGAIVRHNGTYRTNAIELTMKKSWKNEYTDITSRQYSWVIGKADNVIVDRWYDATRDWDNMLMTVGDFYSSAVKALRM